jgi:hypothetical protein
MKRLFLTVSVGAITLAAALHAAAGSVAVVSARAITVPGATFECDIRCTETICEPGETHDAYEVAEEDEYLINATRNGGVHLDFQCKTGTCATKHGPLCNNFGELAFTDAEFEAVRAAVAAADLDATHALVRRYEKRIQVNSQRLAIQISDCAGNMVAHLPISKGFVSALAEDRNRIAGRQAAETN